MAQRLVHIILPHASGDQAINMLQTLTVDTYWLETSSAGKTVINVLLDSSESGHLMDMFEKAFSSVAGFRIIVVPVEASIPRAIMPPDVPEATGEPGPADTMKISQEELYADIVDSAQLSGVYAAMVLLSTVVAALGLMKNNVAVIIGAMVIAPFLGPNVAMALSTNLADYDLGKRALKTLVAGVTLAFVLAVLLGGIFDIDPSITEIASRTRASLSDIVLALASGAAGVLAFTTGVSGVVIGVMVAVALLPPLTVSGLLLGAGFYHQSFFAFLLFLTNIICINLAGIITFFIRGISPRKWWEADKAKKATRNALVLWTALLALLAVVIILWAGK